MLHGFKTMETATTYFLVNTILGHIETLTNVLNSYQDGVNFSAFYINSSLKLKERNTEFVELLFL